MKGSEVLKALEEGKKMRIKDWRQHEYIELKDNELVDEEGIDQDMLGLNIFLKGEWEEYKEPFEVGDLLIYTHTNSILEVTNIYQDERFIDVKGNNDVYINCSVDHFRKATKEEIKQELERRKWEKISRKVNEFKVGDIVVAMEDEMLYIVNDTECDYGYIELLSFSENTRIISSPSFMRMICPVENRFDKVN